MVASDAPADPSCITYMNMGSRITFSITETITAYIALFMSPSPRSIPLAPFANMNPMSPANNGVPYFIASVSDCPVAPYAFKSGSCSISSIADSNIEATRNISNECSADRFAFSWFLAPTNLLMLLVAPLPSPTLTPFSIMNIGVTNPIPAIAACPSPATHIPSIMLYDAVSNIEIIIGRASFLTAIFGSPLINSTFSFDMTFSPLILLLLSLL